MCFLSAERGIADGAPVRVSNERGSFVVVAKLTDETAPGVVAAYMGNWRKFAKDLSTVAAVSPFAFADLDEGVFPGA